MRWLRKNTSTDNFEDRRGRSSGKLIAGGGIGAFVVAAVVFFVTGSPRKAIEIFTQGAGGPVAQQEAQYIPSQEEEALKEQTLLVFNSCNDVWSELLSKARVGNYQKPNLVLYTDYVQSSCGNASKEVGPFYCPADAKVYIDLSFFHELATKFGAPGDLAMAYVTAHEVGHHVQNLLGLSDQLQQLRQRLSEEEFNRYSVKMELNADYLAGVWAHHAVKMGIIALDEGDIDEAINAAEAVGDDTLQKKATGRVVPEAFTHGSSRQRKEAFYRGFQSGVFTGNELVF